MTAIKIKEKCLDCGKFKVPEDKLHMVHFGKRNQICRCHMVKMRGPVDQEVTEEIQNFQAVEAQPEALEEIEEPVAEVQPKRKRMTRREAIVNASKAGTLVVANRFFAAAVMAFFGLPGWHLFYIGNKPQACLRSVLLFLVIPKLFILSVLSGRFVETGGADGKVAAGFAALFAGLSVVVAVWLWVWLVIDVIRLISMDEREWTFKHGLILDEK
jgi:hypothetical protein